MDSVIQLQLVLVRSLFDRARAASMEGTDIGSMTALLIADLAVESTVKQVLAHVGTSLGRDKLEDLLDAMSKAIPKLNDPKLLAKARRLRQARNPVQHSAMPPAPNLVERHLQEAEAFVTEVVKVAFEDDFGSLSVVSLVASPDLKNALEAARGLLDTGELEEATLYLGATFRALLGYAGRWSRRALGLGRAADAFLPRRLCGNVIRVFGPDHPQGAQITLEDDPRLGGHDAPLTVLALGFPVLDLALLQAVEERSEIIDTSRTEGHRVHLPPPLPYETLARSLEVLARQIWRIESTHPELLSATDPLKSLGVDLSDDDAEQDFGEPK